MYGLQTLRKLNEEAIANAPAEQAEEPRAPRKTPLFELAAKCGSAIIDATDLIARAFPPGVDPNDSKLRSRRVARLNEAANLLETAAHWARVTADRIEYSTGSDSRS